MPLHDTHQWDSAPCSPHSWITPRLHHHITLIYVLEAKTCLRVLPNCEDIRQYHLPTYPQEKENHGWAHKVGQGAGSTGWSGWSGKGSLRRQYSSCSWKWEYPPSRKHTAGKGHKIPKVLSLKQASKEMTEASAMGALPGEHARQWEARWGKAFRIIRCRFCPKCAPNSSWLMFPPVN